MNKILQQQILQEVSYRSLVLKGTQGTLGERQKVCHLVWVNGLLASAYVKGGMMLDADCCFSPGLETRTEAAIVLHSTIVAG